MIRVSCGSLCTVVAGRAADQRNVSFRLAQCGISVRRSRILLCSFSLVWYQRLGTTKQTGTRDERGGGIQSEKIAAYEDILQLIFCRYCYDLLLWLLFLLLLSSLLLLLLLWLRKMIFLDEHRYFAWLVLRISQHCVDLEVHGKQRYKIMRYGFWTG